MKFSLVKSAFFQSLLGVNKYSVLFLQIWPSSEVINIGVKQELNEVWVSFSVLFQVVSDSDIQEKWARLNPKNHCSEP